MSKKEIKDYTFNGIARKIYHAFLCEPKNGNGPQFSTKKCLAIVFCLLAIIDDVKLVVFPWSHFSVHLTQARVAENVIIALITVQNALAVSALSIYGWAKVRKAP
jgi:hypothetical protein